MYTIIIKFIDLLKDEHNRKENNEKFNASLNAVISALNELKKFY